MVEQKYRVWFYTRLKSTIGKNEQRKTKKPQKTHVATEQYMAFSEAAFVHQPVIHLWLTPWHIRQLDSWVPTGGLEGSY